MTLTTTLNRLRASGACQARYAHLLRALGGTSFDHNAPINLLTILEHNGVGDCLWALQATVEDCERIARLMAADFAEMVLPIYEQQYPGDTRPRAAIVAAREFALGHITSMELSAAREVAASAASAAASVAASAAAWEVAWEARDATEDIQAKIIRSYLLKDGGEVSA